MAAGEHPELETPENRLLLACARTTLREQDAERIRALLRTEIDWERLLSDARRHRVTLLLDRSLKAADIGQGTHPYHERLRDHTRAFAARNAFLVQALTRLLARFEAEQIPTIPYKGPVIASLAYGDIRLREFNDLDFLIRPQDVARVCAVLRSEGFETANRLTPRETAHVQREFKEYCFQSGLVVVEPHWSITARRFPFPIDYDALWNRAQPTCISNATVRVFAREDLLLIQCVTGGKSRWRRLELVCDVAETIRAFPGVDWHAVERSARATGSERLLLLGVGLATHLLDAPVPEEIAARIDADPHVRRLTRRVIKALFGARNTGAVTKRSPSQFSPLLMTMRERPSHRWLYLWRTLTTPTLTHLRRFPLPDWLWPLYRLLVPLHDYIARPIVQLSRGLWVHAHSPSRTP